MSSLVRTIQTRDAAFHICISPDNQHAAVSTCNYQYNVFSLKDGTLVDQGYHSTYNVITSSLAFSHDGVYLICGRSTGDVWVSAFAPILRLPPNIERAHERRVNQIVVSEDNRFVVSASDDGTARVFSMETG